jgi:hypothetical protein
VRDVEDACGPCEEHLAGPLALLALLALLDQGGGPS